jgi:hypothetical protein
MGWLGFLTLLVWEYSWRILIWSSSISKYQEKEREYPTFPFSWKVWGKVEISKVYKEQKEGEFM